MHLVLTWDCAALNDYFRTSHMKASCHTLTLLLVFTFPLQLFIQQQHNETGSSSSIKQWNKHTPYGGPRQEIGIPNIYIYIYITKREQPTFRPPFQRLERPNNSYQSRWWCLRAGFGYNILTDKQHRHTECRIILTSSLPNSTWVVCSWLNVVCIYGT